MTRRPTANRTARILCGVLAVVTANSGLGQSVLPDVRLDLPKVGSPAGPVVGLPAVEAQMDGRHLHLQRLLRMHRDQLDIDSHGAVIVRNEILAYGPTPTALRAAGDVGFVVLRRQALDGLDADIVVLQPPAGLRVGRALQRLRELDPAGLYDFNHIYLDSGAVSASSVSPGAPQPPSPSTSRSVRVGLIDGGVATMHPALAAADVRTHGCDGIVLPSDHGTAVASLLLGAIGGEFRPDHRPQLYAADVYCGLPTGGAVDGVVAALAWMLREQVPVVNVSLVGPPNRLLEHVIALAVSRGQTVVAAVGNDGPAAPPLYPASYPAVVAVTAVDRHHKVLLEAGRATHVDFAAQGSDVMAAALPDGTAAVRGTSFAAPVVAGLLARSSDRLDRPSADANVRALGERALDLGAPGVDPVYGRGLVGATPTAP